MIEKGGGSTSTEATVTVQKGTSSSTSASAGAGGYTLQKSKSGKELGLVEVNAPIYPVDTKHTFPPG